MNSAPQRPDLPLALVLSGGNALGAYHAGVYQALHEAGWLPDRVVGASAGAITGAVICGNPADQRLDRLAALWRPASDQPSSPGFLDETRRSSAAVKTMLMGQPGIFAPRSLYGPWWNPFGNPEPTSLYDTTPLAATMAQLVDFDLLNANNPRFACTALDVESGEDVIFDTQDSKLTPQHLRASSALMPAFSPVEVDGRMLVDAGISANLPLDVVMREATDGPILCIAVDLLPLRGPPPTTLGETLVRMQDLLFAAQSRRTIAAWQAIFDARAASGDCPSITLVHLAFSDHQREVSGKAFDFSPTSARERWQAGKADMSAALTALASQAPPTPGLRVLSAVEREGATSYEQVTHLLGPHPA